MDCDFCRAEENFCNEEAVTWKCGTSCDCYNGVQRSEECLKREEENKLIDWITSCSFPCLLLKWRIEPQDSPLHQGRVGSYFAATLQMQRKLFSTSAFEKISKQVDSEINEIRRKMINDRRGNDSLD